MADQGETNQFEGKFWNLCLSKISSFSLSSASHSIYPQRRALTKILNSAKLQGAASFSMGASSRKKKIQGNSLDSMDSGFSNLVKGTFGSLQSLAIKIAQIMVVTQQYI